LHIGNYFGAIKQHIERQDQGDCFYFIADYHSLTTLKESEEKEIAAAAKVKGDTARTAQQIFRDNVHAAALDYLALGLDPHKAAFYRQSDIPEVNELAWFLASVTGHGLLERAHSFKDKVAKGIAPSAGLFYYPVLMAADILIVRSHLVPVGKDQEQHLEMARDMARAFNHAYGEVFPEPEAVYSEAPVVPGTDGQKMSKSATPTNTIDIFAEGKALQKTVMSIVTDSTPADSPKRPETCNVFALYKLFATADELQEMADHYRDPMKGADARNGRPFGYGDAKTMLLSKIDHYFAQFRERRKQLERDPGVVEEVLVKGARRAREVAQVTMRLVRRAVGMVERPV
jgi:tryptophanyl-tRNA synthetase